jgi:hypothetical protein
MIISTPLFCSARLYPSLQQVQKYTVLLSTVVIKKSIVDITPRIATRDVLFWCSTAFKQLLFLHAFVCSVVFYRRFVGVADLYVAMLDVSLE